MENGIFFFKFEMLATNIDQYQILKNICQQLLSLNNVLKLLTVVKEIDYVHKQGMLKHVI